MTPIYILGSGGFAKEVYFLIQSIVSYDVKGFVDVEEKETVLIGQKKIEVFNENVLSRLPSNTALAIGIGNPFVIQKLVEKNVGVFFPNLIHPNVIGNFEDIELGSGNIITANCVFTTSIRIGSYNIFNLGCTVGHDTVIGNYNVINPAVNISGGVVIGNNNLLGVNSTLLQYKTVGNGCIVGGNSLVNKDVVDGTTVVGVPAKELMK